MTKLHKKLAQYAKTNNDFELYEYVTTKASYKDLQRMKQAIQYA